MLEINILEVITEIIDFSVAFAVPFGLTLGGVAVLLSEGLNLALKLFKS